MIAWHQPAACGLWPYSHVYGWSRYNACLSPACGLHRCSNLHTDTWQLWCGASTVSATRLRALHVQLVLLHCGSCASAPAEQRTAIHHHVHISAHPAKLWAERPGKQGSAGFEAELQRPRSSSTSLAFSFGPRCQQASEVIVLQGRPCFLLPPSSCHAHGEHDDEAQQHCGRLAGSREPTQDVPAPRATRASGVCRSAGDKLIT